MGSHLQTEWYRSQSKARQQHHRRHERERHQQQVPPSKRIDRPDRRAREHEVDRAVSPRSDGRRRLRKATLDEDVRRVVCDRVDPAELLHEHDDEGGEGGTAVAGDGEQLEETVAAREGLGLSLKLHMDV